MKYMCTMKMKIWGNYNDEIYGSINTKRALKDTQDVYDTPLQVEYGPI